MYKRESIIFSAVSPRRCTVWRGKTVLPGIKLRAGFFTVLYRPPASNSPVASVENTYSWAPALTDSHLVIRGGS